MRSRPTPTGGLTGILTGACLTLAFAGLATSIATLFQHQGLMQPLNVLAFIAVGWATLRLGQRPHVLEPAVGAGSAMLLFRSVELAIWAALRDDLGYATLVGCLFISVAFAFSLAWLGALLASGGRLRETPSPSMDAGFIQSPTLTPRMAERRSAAETTAREDAGGRRARNDITSAA